jgi:hypothetical protein
MMRWRFALGVCMVSAALLVGSAGGAIAAADPDPVDSTAESQGVDGSTQGVGGAGRVEGAEPKRAPDSLVIRAKREASQTGIRHPDRPDDHGCHDGTQAPAPTGTNESVTAVTEQQTKVRIQHGGYHRGRLESGRSRVSSAGGRASAAGRIRSDCGCTGSRAARGRTDSRRAG